MRRLTILSVAYPLASVSIDAVGGAEQVQCAIDRALVAAGHRSIVLAMAGSRSCGQLVTYPSLQVGQIITNSLREKWKDFVRSAIRQITSDVHVDVVHMHGLDFDQYLPPAGPPVLATLHLPIPWYSQQALSPARPDTWLNCVSEAQAASVGPNPYLLPLIQNGVPVMEFSGALHLRRGRYAAMLARVCPEKGQHLALQAARDTDTDLLIGGEVFPYEEHQEYFQTEIRPLLDRRRRYIGPVGFRQKRRLLAGACCLLVPSLVAETSSLVSMEAACCGTPVIAFRSGALPEIVEHERTGFIVNDVAGMKDAIRRLSEIAPEACVTVAHERFAVEKMTDAYIKRYETLAQTKAAGTG